MEVSIFRNFWDKQPVESTLEETVEAIRSDERTKELTLGYRQQKRDILKNESMLFAVPCIFEGGKAQKNVVRLTGVSMVDFDHIGGPSPRFCPPSQCSPIATIPRLPKGEGSNLYTPNSQFSIGAGCALNSQLDNLRMKIVNDPHTLLCYTTISGEGIRVLFRYELDETYELKQQIQFYKKAFMTGNAYYERLIGAKADGQCKNVTRLSVVAHDAEVYYNPDAEAFTAEWIDSEWEQMQQPMKENRKLNRELARIRALYAKTIRPEVESEGAVYAPGNHNDYVMRVGYRLNQFGFSLASATEWAVSEFADYDRTADIIASCYEKTEEHGKRSLTSSSFPREKGDKFASVEEIEAFLTENVKLRRNVITGRTEWLNSLTPNPSPKGEGNFRRGESKGNWVPITDTKVNSLWKDMSKIKRVNVQDFYRIIESDFVAEFHPFREYLKGLTPSPSSLPLPPPKEGDDERDYIRELAETVKVRERSPLPLEGQGEAELFYQYLKKWLVAMVAGWVDDNVVNNVILVLIGEQGSYKTTWFNYLLPPELKAYFYTKTNSNRMTKDDLLTLAQYGLVCCEELDTMSPKDLNQLKAAVTMPSIDERAAYAHFHEHRAHIASFCGTGNNVQFLSDPTGNRRWLPFEVEQIRNPREYPFNYEGIYSQAYQLYKSGFQFWFDQDEIKRLSRHNEHYETAKQERELVDVYFRKPRELEGGEFMPVSRAMQIVGGNTVQTLSDVRLGRAFRDLGFACKRTCQGRGYIVVCRTAEEIKARQRMLAVCDT